MIPVYQTKFGNDGNCLQACVGSLLELSLESVPDFFSSNIKWYKVFHKYFKTRGLNFLGFRMGAPPSDGSYYIVSMDTGCKDYSHAAIYKDGKVVHDPYPIDGEMSDYVDKYEVDSYYVFESF